MIKTQRKYRMIRVSAGDYLLPGNDGKLWRVWQYEDGPSHGIEDWPRDVMLWACSKWVGVKPPDQTDEPLEFEHWQVHADCFATRAEAVEAALAKELEPQPGTR